MLGMVAFGTTSVLAAASTTPAQLIGWRAAMGIGAALIFPATLAVLVNVFTDARQRAIAISVWAATSGLAVALGPVTGGYLLEHFFWGSVFMVNVPVIAIALVAIWRVVPTSRDTTIKRFDPLGIVLSIAGVTVLVWAVIEGPKHGWGSLTSVAAFALAVVLLAAFIRWERRSDHPMLDVTVFSNMRFTAGSISVAFAFFALFGFIFMVTQYFQFVRGYGTLEAGVRTVPFAVFTGMAAPVSAKLAERFGTKAIVASGLIAMAMGFAWTTRDTATSSYWLVVGQMFLMGGGLGLVNAPATEAIMGALPPAKAGVGSAVNDTTREVGGAMGVAVIGSILAAQYRSGIKPQLASVQPEVAAIARDGVSALSQLASTAPDTPGVGPLLTVARSSFVDGMQIGLRVSAAIAVAIAVAVWRSYPSGHLRPSGTREPH
jgi:EmrB/QacA subfamily drug resistance transporter